MGRNQWRRSIPPRRTNPPASGSRARRRRTPSSSRWRVASREVASVFMPNNVAGRRGGGPAAPPLKSAPPAARISRTSSTEAGMQLSLFPEAGFTGVQKRAGRLGELGPARGRGPHRGPLRPPLPGLLRRLPVVADRLRPGLPHVPPDGHRADAPPRRDGWGDDRTGPDGAGPLPARGRRRPAASTSTSWRAASRWPTRPCWRTPTASSGNCRGWPSPWACGPAIWSRPSTRGSWANRPLEDVFVTHHPDIYYSIYSMSERFRRRWLPKALPAEAALDRLTSWQRSTHKIVTLHHAYIAGENDAEGDVHAICDALEERGLMVHVNIVRYNPHDPSRHGVEPPEEVIERNAAIYRSRLPNARVSVIARVGFDVAASCGMFFGPAGPGCGRHPAADDLILVADQLGPRPSLSQLVRFPELICCAFLVRCRRTRRSAFPPLIRWEQPLAGGLHHAVDSRKPLDCAEVAISALRTTFPPRWITCLTTSAGRFPRRRKSPWRWSKTPIRTTAGYWWTSGSPGAPPKCIRLSRSARSIWGCRSRGPPAR